MKKLKAYIPAMVVAAIIIYLSLATGDGLPKVHFSFPNMDKVVHGLMYAGLSLVLGLGLHYDRVRPGKNALIAFAIGAALGGLIELIQPLFPPRSCEALDFAADCAGSVVGWIIAYFAWIRQHSVQP